MTKTISGKARARNIEDLAAANQQDGLREFTVATSDGRISQTARIAARNRAQAANIAIRAHREATGAPSSVAVLVTGVAGGEEVA